MCVVLPHLFSYYLNVLKRRPKVGGPKRQQFASVYVIISPLQGEIQIRFVSPPSEARPRTGDLCQMVESIAFFEAYRPVLEGLQMMSYNREFPFQVHARCLLQIRK